VLECGGIYLRICDKETREYEGVNISVNFPGYVMIYEFIGHIIIIIIIILKLINYLKTQ